jgi:PGF-CTERM protein
MNTKTLLVLLFLTIAILSVVPESFARPQYLTNLTAIYGNGSCATCHVIASGSGMRNSNGTVGQHNPIGTYVPRNTNRTPGQRRSNGMPNSNRTLPLNSYGTLFEKQADHAADPSAALMAIGQPSAATATPQNSPADTAATATGTKAAPGFGFAVALFGLFVCALLVRRHNK